MIKQILNDKEVQIVNNNIQFIDYFTTIGKTLGCRVVIAGGFAVDGALGKVTRAHNDIDIQIYFQDSDPLKIIRLIIQQIKQKAIFPDIRINDRGKTTYYHNVFLYFGESIADVYYLQTISDPFQNEKIIVKTDDTITEKHPFDTLAAELNGIHFEIQYPLVEIVDKLYKRNYRGDEKLEKHEQDIKNLEEIVDKKEVQTRLNSMIN